MVYLGTTTTTQNYELYVARCARAHATLSASHHKNSLVPHAKCSTLANIFANTFGIVVRLLEMEHERFYRQARRHHNGFWPAHGSGGRAGNHKKIIPHTHTLIETLNILFLVHDASGVLCMQIMRVHNCRRAAVFCVVHNERSTASCAFNFELKRRSSVVKLC